MRRCQAFNLTGCPIRISTDLGLFASPRGFSQLITSFFASYSQGIHQSPLLSSLFLSRYSRSNTFAFALVFTSLSVDLLLCIMSKIVSPFCGVSSTRSVSRDFVVYLEKTTNVYWEKPVVCLFVCFLANECFCLFCPFGHSIKEVFQPHLPVRLPCYDLAPVTGFTLGRSS